MRLVSNNFRIKEMSNIKTIIALAAATIPTLLGGAASAQDTGQDQITTLGYIINQIKAHNTELKALRGEADATKAEAKAGAALPDPEVSFGYLWYGRKDVSASQSFDWATITGRRRASVQATDTLAEFLYTAGYNAILTQATKAYIATVRANATLNILSAKKRAAESMAHLTRRRLDAGTARKDEAMTTQMAKTQALAELTRAQAERDEQLAIIAALNGGIAIDVQDSTFSATEELGGDFESWYAVVSPFILSEKIAAAQMQVAEAQRSIARASAAPTISLGYMGEFTPDDHYEGVTIGLTVPLWSARHRTNQASLAAQAARDRETAIRKRSRAVLRAAYDKALMLGRVASEMRENLEKTDSRYLTIRALERGEISASEAIMANNLYFDTAIEAINAEAEYRTAIIELYAQVGG